MATPQDLSVFVRHAPGGVAGMELAVDGIRCAGCMHAIEDGLAREAGLLSARVNLALKRVTVEWREGALRPEAVVERLAALGFKAYPFLPADQEGREAREEARLLRCLGVAGFAAMNIMLLSVSVWAGNASDIEPSTRDLFHWLSALIALPTAAYAGRPFFESALRALRAGSVNMDVPITLGVVLALAMSVVETWQHSRHAYFDGAVMLLFFLLVGRYLDQLMRRRTRDLAGNLAALKAETATRLAPDGTAVALPIAAIVPGDLVLVAPGERVSVDGIVEGGRSELDQSLVTGETAPATVGRGERVYAGTLNLSGALRVRVEAAGSGTLLDDIDRLMSQAVENRSRYVKLSDRAARLYAPLVHATALATFLGWLALGLGWQQALLIAVTVLIITCPCALGLAIPAVQVVAASALFRQRVMLKHGDALEVREYPGQGLTSRCGGSERRLGSVDFCQAQEQADVAIRAHPDASLIAYRNGDRRIAIAIGQRLRPQARETVAALQEAGFAVMILSGDRPQAVAPVAAALGITEARAGLLPGGKLELLDGLARKGRKVLMVGDGLNDAPALAASHVSISPVSASHLAQSAADIVFLGDSLAPVAQAVAIGRKARRLMIQNLWLAVLYNAIAVPVAIAGLVTPLIAAAAMSGSSLVVTLNALRARSTGGGSAP